MKTLHCPEDQPEPRPSQCVDIRIDQSKPAPLAYTVAEAAVALNVCTKTIRRLLDRGLLTSSNALRKKLIPRQQLDEFLKKTCNKPRL